jgi:hypothetical protein
MTRRVRLTPPVRVLMPDIGDATGTVLETFDSAVRVAWPGDRVAWHRRGDLEDATNEEDTCRN